jgi:hypothetical protein
MSVLDANGGTSSRLLKGAFTREYAFGGSAIAGYRSTVCSAAERRPQVPGAGGRNAVPVTLAILAVIEPSRDWVSSGQRGEPDGAAR